MLKSKTVIQKILSKNLKFQQTQSKIVFQCTSLPYNFEGLHPGLDQEQSQKVRFFVQQTIGNDLEQGFAYAYSNIIQAIAQKDLEFLKDILEPRLYANLQSSLLSLNTQEEHFALQSQQIDNTSEDLLQQQKSQSQIIMIGDEDIQPSNLVFGKFDFHMGVKFERDRNGNLKGQKQDMNMMNMVTMNFYGMGGGMGGMGGSQFFSSSPTRPIVRLDTYFSSNLKLCIRDAQGQIIKGNEDPKVKQIHKIRFETDPGDAEIQKAGSLMQSLFKFQTGGNKEKIFTDLFLGENYEWKVADIDDYLNGNEFDQ